MSRLVPGEVIPATDPVELFTGREVTNLRVLNTGDRPVQVGSHYHFAEANGALEMDRSAAAGRRLAIPAGTSVRFEPGLETTVSLVPFGGKQIAAGFSLDGGQS
jgi:urease subunit beta